MAIVGKEPCDLSTCWSAAVRTDLRPALPRRRLPQFLVLDFFLRQPLRRCRALAHGSGSAEGELLGHTALHQMALGARADRRFRGVLESHCSSPCCVCLRPAAVFLRRCVSRPLFPAPLFCPYAARNCHPDRSCSYLRHPLAHREVYLAMDSRSAGDRVWGRMCAYHPP